MRKKNFGEGWLRSKLRSCEKLFRCKTGIIINIINIIINIIIIIFIIIIIILL